MTIAAGLVAEFEHESAVTRKMLERVPEEKLSWKPHEKSMTLGRLATHLAELSGWVPTIMDQEVLDLGDSDYKPRVVESKEELLEMFDSGVAGFVEGIKDRTDEEFFVTWTLRVGERVVTELPRIAALRGFVLSHAFHHRGQLSVFLRLLDVPLPQIYGPTADDRGDFGS
jgi:uncharacterized damage-inducible protein DinB